MKISTKGRYGLTALVDIAINSTKENVTLKSISERQNISERYLEQIFSTLRKAGIVSSIKGSQGGYFLSSSPSSITVGMILRALEGSLKVVDDSNVSDKLQYCIQTTVWDSINKSIDSVVDSITLEDLVFEYNKLMDTSRYIYYI